MVRPPNGSIVANGNVIHKRKGGAIFAPPSMSGNCNLPDDGALHYSPETYMDHLNSGPPIISFPPRRRRYSPPFGPV